MFRSRLVVLLLAVPLLLLGSASAAFAGPHDNNDAGVTGVAARNADEGCPVGNFCIYTGTNYTGRVFWLYYCREYSLTRWNDFGSFFNNNSGGAHGYIRNQDHSLRLDTAPGEKASVYDFKPVWYITAC